MKNQQSRVYPCPYFVDGQWCTTAIMHGDQYICRDCGATWTLDGDPLKGPQATSIEAMCA